MEPNQILDDPLSGDSRQDRKRRAIVAVLRSSSFAEAARTAGIDRDTLRRWRQDPAFQQALSQARLESHMQSLESLQLAASAAMDRLVTVACDPQAPPTVRLRAVETIVKLGRQAWLQADLQPRLENLEGSFL